MSVDSLVKIWQKLDCPEKIHSLDKIAYYYRRSEPETGLYCAKQAFYHLEKCPHDPAGYLNFKCEFLKSIGIAYEYKNKLDSTLLMADLMTHLADSIGKGTKYITKSSGLLTI